MESALPGWSQRCRSKNSSAPDIEVAQITGRLDREYVILKGFLDPGVVACRGREQLQHWARGSVAQALGGMGGLPYLVLELATGSSLRRLLVERRRQSKRSKRSLPLWEAVSLFDPLLRALASLHRRGIFHRDLKPGNIVLSVDGSSARLLDWNLGKIPTYQQELTSPRQRPCGSPPYCGPGQMNQLSSAKGAADNYSIAAIMAGAFSVFRFADFCAADNLPDLALVRHVLLSGTGTVGRGPQPGGIGAQLPQSLTDVLLRALAPSTGHRADKIEALRQALRETYESDEDETVALRNASSHWAPHTVLRSSPEVDSATVPRPSSSGSIAFAPQVPTSPPSAVNVPSPKPAVEELQELVRTLSGQVAALQQQTAFSERLALGAGGGSRENGVLRATNSSALWLVGMGIGAVIAALLFTLGPGYFLRVP